MNAMSPDKLIAAYQNPSLQELFILPTEQCNFRCDYCYEDFKIGKMKPAVVAGILNLIRQRSPTLRLLHLSWFGGEPLLASDIVIEISAAALALSHQYGYRFKGTLTTNGWGLTPELFGQLLDLQQNQFQITLDGWETGHDATRKLASGRGTFDRIWENLLAARRVARDFRIAIRLHLTEGNFESLETLCARLAEAFGSDDRFTYDFQDVRPLGGPRAGAIRKLDPTEVRRRVDRLSQALGSPSPAEGSGGRISSNHGAEARGYVCYASKANSLVIRADGSIAKCTVELTSARNAIGRIHDDGTLEMDDRKLRFWTRGLTSRESSELACPAIERAT